MDTIRILLGAIVKIVIALFVGAFVLWLVGLLYPSFKVSNLIKKNVFTFDWLPAPKNYRGLLGTQSATNGKVYQPGPAYSGYAGSGTYSNGADVEWTVYTGTDSYVVRSNPQNANTISNATGYSDRSLYIRNLSIYPGASISYGMTIYGEAKDTMFRNAIFTLAIIDRSGRVIASTQAVNTGSWAAPGWTRFQVTIPTRLPTGVDCALIFYSANEPVKVGIPVTCN